MATVGVVVDAWALYPASLRDTLLCRSEQELYRLQWTDAILDELRRNLIADAHVSEGDAQRLIERMQQTFKHATVTGYEPLISAMPTHQDDRHVAAAAVASGCQVVVTLNLRHFPAQELQPFNIEPQSPDVFLTHLYHLYPNKLRTILAQQVAQLTRPPRSAEQVLASLARFAPGFVDLCR